MYYLCHVKFAPQATDNYRQAVGWFLQQPVHMKRHNLKYDMIMCWVPSDIPDAYIATFKDDWVYKEILEATRLISRIICQNGLGDFYEYTIEAVAELAFLDDHAESMMVDKKQLQCI